MAGLAVLAALSVLVPCGGVPVSIQGRKVLVDGKPLFLKGVNWNPVPAGGQQGHGGVHFRGFVETDSVLMAAAGINALRTYEPITDVEVLDILWQRGIRVLNTVYISGDADPETVIEPVKKLKDHAAILMWVIGNEWNYNNLYSGLMFDGALNRVREVARLIKTLDQTHPVATVYGMMPGPDQISALPDVDVWGLTAYTGITFGNLFDVWVSRSEKPMFLAEFGADAYNAKTERVDEEDQARATARLTREIMAHSVERGGVCVGGFIFELADEWWKDGKGSPKTHDVGGVAPGGGPYPDNTFNEEYWGIVRNDGTPRKAYGAYAAIAAPGESASSDHPSGVSVSDVTPGYRLRACGANPDCSSMLGDCCPNAVGMFRSCCSEASKQAAASGRHPRAPAPLARPSRPPQHERPEHTQPLAPLAPWTPKAHAAGAAGPPSSRCVLEAAVPCCLHGDCGTCAGEQCCPSKMGSVTCPSASKALAKGCIHPKLYDCTGKTGTKPPPTTTTETAARSTTTSTKQPLDEAPSPPPRPTATTEQITLQFHPSNRAQPTTRTTATTNDHHFQFSIHHAPDVETIHEPVRNPFVHLLRTPAPAERTTTTTPGLSISVHTTMKVPYRSQSPGAWVLGPEKLSCDEVCASAGGCVEGGWPTEQSQFLRIVRGLGYACFDLQEGAGQYDPSTQQGNCGWRWSARLGASHAGSPAPTRCAAGAPAFTRRFCPCLRAPPGATIHRSPPRERDVVMEKRRLLQAAPENGQPLVFA